MPGGGGGAAAGLISLAQQLRAAEGRAAEPRRGDHLRPGIGLEAGDDVLVGNGVVQRDDRQPPRALGHAYAGSIRPRTSPRGSPRSTTSSPSSRNVRVPSATLDRLGAVPGQLDQAAFAATLGARDRARRHQVARPDARSVRGRMRELLRHRPVEARERCRARQRRRSTRPRAAGRSPSRPRRAGAAAARAAEGARRPGGPGAARAASPTPRSRWRSSCQGRGRAARTPTPGCRGRSSR